MRMNNLSARLKINQWLQAMGYNTIPGHLSYIEFANELRKIIGSTVVQVPFTDRADATKYIRFHANQLKI